MRQVVLGRPDGYDSDAFERLLYLTRKRIERRLAEAALGPFYVPSFSSRTISYKGLMVADQLPNFYLDLADPEFVTSIAVFHQRTAPTPCRGGRWPSRFVLLPTMVRSTPCKET